MKEGDNVLTILNMVVAPISGEWLWMDQFIHYYLVIYLLDVVST